MTVLHIFHAFSSGKTPWFSTVFPFFSFPSAYIYRRGWKNLIFGAAKRGGETVQCTVSDVTESDIRGCTEQQQVLHRAISDVAESDTNKSIKQKQSTKPTTKEENRPLTILPTVPPNSYVTDRHDFPMPTFIGANTPKSATRL